MLKALLDANLPKFLDQDILLFRGILSDLFPGVVLPRYDYDNLNKAVRSYCVANDLQYIDSFYNKIVQLYEMVIVRHGLMLVGYSFSMKTECYKALAASLTEMNT